MGWLRDLAGKTWEPQQIERLDQRIASLQANGQPDDAFGESESSPPSEQAPTLEEVQSELARTTLLLNALADACIERGIVTREQLAALADGSGSIAMLEPTASPGATTSDLGTSDMLDTELEEEDGDSPFGASDEAIFGESEEAATKTADASGEDAIDFAPENEGEDVPFSFGESAGDESFSFSEDGAGAAEAPAEGGTATQPRKKKKQGSLVRQIVGVFGGGIVGLSIGYMIILWVGGDDFLQLRDKLPGWMVPGSATASAEDENIGNTKGTSKVDAFNNFTGTGTGASDFNNLQDKFAGMDGPKTPAKKPRGKNNKKQQPPAGGEPAPELGLGGEKQDDPLGLGDDELAIENPLAGGPSLPEEAPQPVVKVSAAPAFASDKLGESLKAARDAQPDMHSVDTSDPDFGTKKTAAYKAYCELAHRLTFATGSEDQDQLKPRRDAAHSMALDAAKVAGLAPMIKSVAGKWFARAEKDRSTPGIFIIGSVTSVEQQGEAQVLTVSSGSAEIPVVLPSAPPVAQGDEVVIQGSIVENAGDKIVGYAGEAAKVVFANTAAVQKVGGGVF